MEKLTDFLQLLCRFQEKARKRSDEYLNSRWSDTPFEIKTLYEMMIDFSNRLEKIEEVMEPAPEKVADPEADALEKPKKGRLY
jgi:flagellar motor component MotA